jgi:hypothetical protein
MEEGILDIGRGDNVRRDGTQIRQERHLSGNLICRNFQRKIELKNTNRASIKIPHHRKDATRINPR